MTEVTVFVEEEQRTLIADPETWKAKVQELGLQGQIEMVEGERTPVPFLPMTVWMVRTFEALCPTKELIGKFDESPIPLQALGAYGLALHENYFEKVEVWFAPGRGDPVMVGTAGKTQYLMAQWGPERLTLEQCRAKAREVWLTRAKNHFEREIAEAQKNLQMLDTVVDRHFAGEYTGVY